MERDSEISISRFPISMMIRCKECGKHFDIVIIGKGSHDYLCPACGKTHSCDYADFMAKAVEACKRTLEKRDRQQ
jgi:Zn finger protein HypA/HybF involved in hydrogenase expression